MKAFLQELALRNRAFYGFGWLCLASALVCALLIGVTDTQVLGINAWIKPMKFFLSTTIFVWTMGWLLVHLKSPRAVNMYTWMVILVFSFELVYIAAQAGLGELSHFNISTGFHATMWSLMGTLIAILTLWTGYMGFLFFRKSFPELPAAYVWGIRLGILLFVIFAFEGMLMGQRLAHSVGGADGSDGLPIVNWSTKFGDLRVAHFMGMHALQILPFVSYYLLKRVPFVILFAIAYLAWVSFVLMQALGGNPFLAW